MNEGNLGQTRNPNIEHVRNNSRYRTEVGESQVKGRHDQDEKKKGEGGHTFAAHT